jgi:hypothetical protein
MIEANFQRVSQMALVVLEIDEQFFQRVSAHLVELPTVSRTFCLLFKVFSEAPNFPTAILP